MSLYTCDGQTSTKKPRHNTTRMCWLLVCQTRKLQPLCFVFCHDGRASLTVCLRSSAAQDSQCSRLRSTSNTSIARTRFAVCFDCACAEHLVIVRGDFPHVGEGMPVSRFMICPVDELAVTTWKDGLFESLPLNSQSAASALEPTCTLWRQACSRNCSGKEWPSSGPFLAEPGLHAYRYVSET